MLYFKAKKNFKFGSNISIVIEVKHSTYNFITHEWHILINFFLNENDIIFNIVNEQIAQYVVEKGATLPEDKIEALITNYIENPKKVIQPIYSKTVSLTYTPGPDQEYPIVFKQISALKTFVANTIKTNPLMLEILPGTLVQINEREFNEKIQKKIEAIIEP